MKRYWYWALPLLFLAVCGGPPAPAAEEITVDTSGLRMEYRQTTLRPVDLCPVGAACTDWTLVPGFEDVWQRGVQDGPDTFPTLRPSPRPPKQKPWSDRRVRAPRVTRDDTREQEVSRTPVYDDVTGEYIGDEVVTTKPKPVVVIDTCEGEHCLNDDDRCEDKLKEACRELAGLPPGSSIKMMKRHFEAGVACNGQCPSGQYIECSGPPAQPQPKPEDQALQ